MIHPLIKVITNKMPRHTLGLMSGTSADGLDIAYCEVNLLDRSLRDLAAATVPYPSALRDKVLDLSSAAAVSLEELSAASHVLGRFYAGAVVEFCRAHQIAREQVDLIGSHGQTVRHLSQPRTVAGYETRATLQIGEAEYLAKAMGVVTVSDFRSADLAVGGSGAPLAPVYHALRFSEKRLTKAVVNIGGIANVSVLKRNGEVLATDTGPGNCLVDTLMRNMFDRDFDADGAAAASGSIHEGLLANMLQSEFMTRTLPLSLDRREMAQLLEAEPIRTLIEQLKPEDTAATLTEFTAVTIQRQTQRLCRDESPSLVLVCGGGAHNRTLLRRLQEHLAPARVSLTTEFGSNVDFVEAETFAYLANLAIEDEEGNLPQVTGAARRAVLGKISLP